MVYSMFPLHLKLKFVSDLCAPNRKNFLENDLGFPGLINCKIDNSVECHFPLSQFILGRFFYTLNHGY